MQGPVEPNLHSEHGLYRGAAEHNLAPAFALQVPDESEGKQRPELKHHKNMEKKIEAQEDVKCSAIR